MCLNIVIATYVIKTYYVVLWLWRLQVWVYDSQKIGQNACCEAKVPFQTLYPSSSSSSSLNGSIDSVFYSYHFRRMFVFAGEDVYENVAYDDRTPGVNLLQRLDAWYHVWYDICDVE